MNNKTVKSIDIDAVIDIVKKAGDTTQEMQGSVVGVDKADGSPVSAADKESSRIVVEGLGALTPMIPVVSEEASVEENAIARLSDLRWVVDPLDGTRTYLNGYEGYGCHLALMDGDTPVLGFAYFPSADENKTELYYTDHDGKSYKQTGQDDAVVITVKGPQTSPDKLTAATGWKDKTLTLQDTDIDLVRAVGGGRLCVTAEGKTDIAVFNGYFSDWDLAAAHAIIKGAGGDLFDMETGQPITYDTDNFAVRPSIGGHKDTVEALLKKDFHGAAQKKPFSAARKRGPNL